MTEIEYRVEDSEENEAFLIKGLQSYNDKYNDYLREHLGLKKVPFGIYAYKDGKVIGGLKGELEHITGWLFIKELYVAEEFRNLDIGSALMKQADKIAREKEFVGIRAATFDFQAHRFYEKQGYSVYGALENYPPGATFFSLKKSLE